MKCPSCGGDKVTFKREKTGSAARRTSYKSIFGTGRTGRTVSQYAYRTEGICQDCGYTWNPNDKKKSGRKNWFWVLGWICMFPVPLTILILRKREMKPAVRYGSIALAWLMFFLIGFTAGEPETVPGDTAVHSTAVVDPAPEIETQMERYYDRDETINLFLNRFNAVNPDQMIDSDLYEVYYHHGSVHDNQIKFTRDNFEVVITAEPNGIKLVIDGIGEKTADEYKLIFMQFARAYNAELTDEKLEEYWQAVLDDIICTVGFIEFDCALQVYNEKIEYMTIEGAVS